MREIDLRHLGRERVICCWQVEDVLIDPGPASSLPALLEALGEWRPRALLLTHIHLDHAGAAGSLARRWPGLEVYVHELGAEHLADPERLLASATRLYGEDMQRLWGEVLPVPREALRALSGGETIAGGATSFRVAYTPGHASHHVAYLHLDSQMAFVGDTAGVRIPPERFVLAPTPPPDIDLEAWQRSLALIGGWRPSALGITHFGRFDDVEGHLEQLVERLRRWGEIARVEDRAGFLERVSVELRAATEASSAAAMEQAMPLEQTWLGLERYWRKRAG